MVSKCVLNYIALVGVLALIEPGFKEGTWTGDFIFILLCWHFCLSVCSH